jgi:hypothetical protein
MSSEADGQQVGERQLGEQLAKLAEGLLAEHSTERSADDGHGAQIPAGQLAVTNALLAIYWELRHQASAPALTRWSPRYLNGRPANHGRAWATEPGA